MYMKFQHSDTNCLHILSSAKTTPLSVGVPVKKSPDQVKQKQQKEVLECPIDDQISKKNGVFRHPSRRNEEKYFSGASFRTKGGIFNGRNGVLQKEEAVATPDSTSGRTNGKMQRNGFEVILKSGGVFSDKENEEHTPCSPTNSGRKLDFGREKAAKSGLVRHSEKRIENNGKSRAEGKFIGSVEKMNTNCSTKWARYGGSIPAMLEALEMVSDLDEALRPWEMTLTNKEQSILLKEQLRWERAMEIFEWFKRKGCYELNVIHYNIMLRILGKARQWSEVEGLCNEMKEMGIEPINSTYGTLIDVYSKGGLREKAMEWLVLMNDRQMEPDEVTMGIVVQMYKKAGDFREAEEFFKKWSANKCVSGVARSNNGGNGETDSNHCLSAYTYNTLLDTYGKGGKVQQARKTFQEMLKKGIVPTTVTFNSMIHMYGNNGLLGEVASLMRTMEKVKCPPDTRTYNILIYLHAKNNDIELAARYLTKMKDASLEPDSVSYRTLLYAFSIRHMVSEAEQLVSEMDERGLEIDEYTQSSLTRMYIEAGMLEKAWLWFLRFHNGGAMTSECYSANIDAFGERGYVSEAEKVFNYCMEKKKLGVLEFNVMIKAYGISKKFEQACFLFDRKRKYGLIPDKCSYNSLVQLLASADLPDKAKFYLRKMQMAGLEIDCVPYCAVISSYVKLGQVGMAVELYDKMIQCGIKPDVIVYGVLINAFAEIGGVKDVEHYVNAMRDMGLPMNVVICKSLIKLYTKVGYLKEAQEAYEALRSFEVDHDVYSSNCMIDLYSKRSMVSEAEEIFENLKRRGDANEFSYAMMLCMYKRNGRFVEAFRISRQMRELGLMTDLLSYNHVLGLYASDGRFKEAAATFDEMLKSNVQPDDSTFKSLGIILLKCGVPKDAIDKLEITRKNDFHSGVQAWSSTLSSFIDVNEDIAFYAQDV